MLKLFRFGKRRIRVRLTAWYIFLLALTLILFSSYLYLQLENSLLRQLDINLQITATQTLTNLVEKNGHPAFKTTAESQTVTHSLTEVGLAVRLLDEQGKVWDGFGNYQALPQFIPKTTGYLNVTGRKTIWRVYSQPLNDGDWLQVAESLKPVHEASKHLLALMLLGFPLVLLIAGLGGLFLADRALRPINQIIRTAQNISANDFSQRIGYQGPPDEVGRLAITINRMLDRIEGAFSHERRFTADAAHELRTPLTVIKGRIGVTLVRERTSAEYETTLQDLEQETDRLIRLTNALLFLARLEQQQEQHPAFVTVDLSNLLLNLVEQMQPLGEAVQIQLNEDLAPGLFIPGNPDYLTNMFLNLIDNALKYTPSGGTVTVTASQEGEQFVVKVKDTGLGIEAQHLPHLMSRFYRVEDARSRSVSVGESRSTGGSGLGLAIAYEIACFHGGSLSVESQVNLGTTFTFRLPTAR